MSEAELRLRAGFYAPEKATKLEKVSLKFSEQGPLLDKSGNQHISIFSMEFSLAGGVQRETKRPRAHGGLQIVAFIFKLSEFFICFEIKRWERKLPSLVL